MSTGVNRPICSSTNFLERQRDWRNTAVIVAYDDSDGCYDHQICPIANQSTSKDDGLTGPLLGYKVSS
jgi:phospholipase C